CSTRARASRVPAGRGRRRFTGALSAARRRALQPPDGRGDRACGCPPCEGGGQPALPGKAGWHGVPGPLRTGRRSDATRGGERPPSRARGALAMRAAGVAFILARAVLAVWLGWRAIPAVVPLQRVAG